MSDIKLHELGDDGPGCRLSVGVSRSGKTHGIKKQIFRNVRRGVPVMALDRMREWKQLPRDIAEMAAGVDGKLSGEDTIPHAVEWMRRGARFVIVRTVDVKRDSVLAAEWALENEDEHRGIAISEVHRAAPNTGGELPEAIEDIALAWAHHNVSFWCDTQRIAECHKTLSENVRELRIHATGGGTDLARLREMGGKELVDAAKECARRMVKPVNEPGWHVLIEVVALPPYILRREAA